MALLCEFFHQGGFVFWRYLSNPVDAKRVGNGLNTCRTIATDQFNGNVQILKLLDQCFRLIAQLISKIDGSEVMPIYRYTDLAGRVSGRGTGMIWP